MRRKLAGARVREPVDSDSMRSHMEESARSRWVVRCCHCAVAVLLVLFTLPSCLTTYLWRGGIIHPVSSPAVSHRYGVAIAVADARGVRLFVEGELLARERRPETGECWLRIELLENERAAAELLASVASGAFIDARVGVTFDATDAPREPGAPVDGSLQLKALDPSAGGDVTGDRHRIEPSVEAACRGVWVRELPNAALQLHVGVSERSEPNEMPVWSKVVLTPFTVAVDLVTTPLVLVGVVVVSAR